MSADRRPLGRAALDIDLPPIGLGCMGMDFAYGSIDRDTGRRVIRAAIELGAFHLDTADMYGPYTNEQLVGSAIADSRDRVVLATKCGLITRDARRFDIDRDGSPEHIVAACDASLQRLGVEQIDLYYLHRVDDRVPVEESVGALAELVAAGKVRAIGLSEVSVKQLRRAHAVHPISAVQSELSLWTRGPLDEVVPWCEANEVTFVAYSPLGRGFFTGRHLDRSAFAEDDFRRQLPRFAEHAMAANASILDAVRQVADRHEVPLGNVALAWVLAQSPRIVAIPGTKRERYLRENLAAADLQLSSVDLAVLDALPAAIGAVR